jgi:putative transposase
MNTTYIPLEAGYFYHIYNRGIDGTNIFDTDDNYKHFLTLYDKYCACIFETYAYCLLRNHFHLLVQVKLDLPTYRELYSHLPRESMTDKADKIVNPSTQLGHLFNAYAQGFNHAKPKKRTGGLFEEPFKRKLVDNDAYFTNLVQYIHYNPQKHGFVDDFRTYHYSSYSAHLSQKPTKLKREEILAWFGNEQNYKTFPAMEHAPDLIKDYILED